MVSAMETYPYPVSAVWAAWAWARCPSFPHPSVSKADGRDDPQVTRALELSLTPSSYNTLENGPCTLLSTRIEPNLLKIWMT